jgi:hypothetical protein
MTQALSRNSLLIGAKNSNNINHYLKTFTSFKNHQWSKLNLEFNMNRAPKTLKKMI